MQEWISSPIGMHPVESGQWVLAADATAERDRLAAENAELKVQASDNYSEATTYLNDLVGYDIARSQLATANATLDRLREVVPKRLADTHIIAAGELKHILYPETTNDDQI